MWSSYEIIPCLLINLLHHSLKWLRVWYRHKLLLYRIGTSHKSKVANSVRKVANTTWRSTLASSPHHTRHETTVLSVCTTCRPTGTNGKRTNTLAIGPPPVTSAQSRAGRAFSDTNSKRDVTAKCMSLRLTITTCCSDLHTDAHAIDDSWPCQDSPKAALHACVIKRCLAMATRFLVLVGSRVMIEKWGHLRNHCCVS